MSGSETARARQSATRRYPSSVLDRPLEKGAFRTRMLAADMIEPAAKMRRGPNRPAQLYRLKKNKSPIYFARTFNPPD
jgi:hypothetical protein